MRRADYEEIIDDMATRLARIALNPGEREESESTRWALELAEDVRKISCRFQIKYRCQQGQQNYLQLL